MRRLRTYPVEDLLLAQLVPGFLFAVGWTVMYELYHEEGSYYTTLMQEILGTEGLLPSFLIMALLMAFPVGILVLEIWFVVKVVRLGGWHVFSLAFIVGTPLVGLGLILALLTRYLTGLGDFHRRVQESIFPPKGLGLPGPMEDAPPSPS